MGTHARQASRTRRLVVHVARGDRRARVGLEPRTGARDYISIVGSSTVYPFATVVAENFGRRNAGFKTPKIEPTGAAAASRRSAPASASSTPTSRTPRAASGRAKSRTARRTASRRSSRSRSATTASCSRTRRRRRTTKSRCATSSSRSRKTFPIRAGTQKLVPNPYTKWSEINSRCRPTKIKCSVRRQLPVRATRSTSSSWRRLQDVPWVAALPRDAVHGRCHTLRDDGPYIDAGENDNLIVQKLDGEPAPARHLRLQLPRAERGQGSRRAHRRRARRTSIRSWTAGTRLAAALLLREEGARRASFPASASTSRSSRATRPSASSAISPTTA